VWRGVCGVCGAPACLLWFWLEFTVACGGACGGAWAHSGTANLRVWDWRSGAQVAAFHEKNYTKETWPAIRFSDDEKLACRWDGSQVQFFENGDLSSVASRLPMPVGSCVWARTCVGSPVL